MQVRRVLNAVLQAGSHWPCSTSNKAREMGAIERSVHACERSAEDLARRAQCLEVNFRGKTHAELKCGEKIRTRADYALLPERFV